MSAIEIMRQALKDGVVIASDGAEGVKVTGDQSMVTKWLPAIRDNKPAILAALSPRQTAPAICHGCTRLEVIEILGGMVAGCLYLAPGQYFDGWRRLPADLSECLFN